MSKKGYKCKPKKRKVNKWVKLIEQALAEGRLAPGKASKLAGYLSWGSSKLFRSRLHVCQVRFVCTVFMFAGNSAEPCCGPSMVKKPGGMVGWRRSCEERSSCGSKC